jgi:thiamine-phosphate pyrophosphorylase
MRGIAQPLTRLGVSRLATLSPRSGEREKFAPFLPDWNRIDPQMTSRRQKEPERPAPRLYLVTPEIADANAFAPALADALSAADIAAVLLRLAPVDERTLINRVKALAKIVQDKDVALILDGHPEIVARTGADGAHLTGIEAFEEAVGGLKPDRIAGIGGLETRHDAMLAAERGTDYVMFGEPDKNGECPSLDAVCERLTWWAEVFQTPCVGYAGNLDEIATLVQAGADFIAAGDFIFSDPRAMVMAAQRALLAEPVS